MYSLHLVPTQPTRLMQVLGPRVTRAIQAVKRANQLLTLIVSILRARMHCKKNAKLKVPLDTLVASTLASTRMPSPSSARESSLKPMSFKASSARRIRRASRGQSVEAGITGQFFYRYFFNFEEIGSLKKYSLKKAIERDYTNFRPFLDIALF